MDYYSLSPSSVLDVKWTALLKVGTSFMREHSNPYYELILVTSGPLYIQVQEEKLTLEAGQTLLLSPWEVHKGWRSSDHQGEFFWVQFSSHPNLTKLDNMSMKELERQGFHPKQSDLRTMETSSDSPMLLPRIFKPEKRYEMCIQFEQMIQESNRPQRYFRFRQTLLLGRLLELLASDFLIHLNQETSLPITYITYRNIVNLLHDSYSFQISKKTLEKPLNRRYEYLSQVFKKYSGITITQYVQQLRIQRAIHLLESSWLNISEIANQVGFDDTFYFSKVFKKLVGQSPQMYRQQFLSKTKEQSSKADRLEDNEQQ